MEPSSAFSHRRVVVYMFLLQGITSPDVFSDVLIAGSGLGLYFSLFCTSRFITHCLVSRSVCQFWGVKNWLCYVCSLSAAL